ncbi:hypothetical protein Bpfe_010909 [Biomphalaria pfeifferi]|uniref:THD domain-containing protein n=1 Tax=Biomphalaria pfeifferi TaxID=112525 RepID=A0AAD8BS08_BIOPF|nr:hypothetical protein Bpfe_010909 [Biomphalaria pfeifferi]
MSPECPNDTKEDLRMFDEDFTATTDAAPWLVTVRGRTRRFILRNNTTICIVSITCCMFLIAGAGLAAYAVNYLHGMERRLEEKLERAILKMFQDQDKNALNANEAFEELNTDQADKTLQFIRSKRHVKKFQLKPKKVPTVGKKPKQRIHPNYFHLTGRNGSVPFYHEGRTFLWAMDKKNMTTSLETVFDSTEGAVQKIRILKKGTYLLYSQVAVHGQGTHQQGYRHECSHETIVTRKSGTVDVLLRSWLTQFNLGDKLDSVYFNRGVTPVDSKLQMGVFTLDDGDEVSVQSQEQCYHFNYSVKTDNSYFGVVAISILK